MLNLIAALILCVVSPLASDADAVRISLFGLFKPQSLEMRVTADSGATLSAGSLSDLHLNKGETVRVRRAGERLELAVVDAFGRVKRSMAAAEISLAPVEAAGLELSVPSKTGRPLVRKLRGALRITAQADELRVVLTTDRESAVTSVVAAELGTGAPPEAYKALAVAARTFMAAYNARHEGEGFDFCDTTHCQLYRGEDDLTARVSSTIVRRAVAETAGEILRFDGEPIEGHYTAACGGLTATPESVWGGATKSAYPYTPVTCRWCAASPYRDWRRESDAASVLAALSAATGSRLSRAAEVTVQTYASSAVVQSVVIKDRGRQLVISGDEFRRALGRRVGWNKVLSPSFRVERRADRFIFRGSGFGSQVGLCVAGATAQAAAGRSYREILTFYFPRAEVKR